jgi:hypothetical protein
LIAENLAHGLPAAPPPRRFDPPLPPLPPIPGAL